MYRISLLVVALLAASSGAAAEWKRVASSDGDGIVAYVDSSTVRKIEGLVRVWALFDLNRSPPNLPRPALSYSVLYEFKCRDEEVRFRASRWYRGNMMKGEVVFTQDEIKAWRSVAPGTIQEGLMLSVCD
jgi:hypothetical protein